jgi:predicted dehydrogenase
MVMTYSMPLPRTRDPLAAPVLRWGLLGAGGIAWKFCVAARDHAAQQLVGVWSRTPETRDRFARENGLSAYETVEALVTDPQIDAVYVASPHTQHLEHALAALAAGKPVLIEKPMAMSAVDGEQIRRAAAAAGKLAMEAMWTRYLPQSDIVRQVLESGELGEIHFVQANFGFRVPMDPANRLWDPDRGGGALLDAGVYPLSFISSVLGAPRSVLASGDALENGVDSRAMVLLTTRSGANATATTSISSWVRNDAVVVGSEGRLELASPFFAPTRLTVTKYAGYTEQPSSWEDTRYPERHFAMSHEIAAFASYVAEGRTDSPLLPLAEAVSVLATIDEARAQIIGGHLS